MATILVIDDQAANRDFLQNLLSRHGHRLLSAEGGVEGLAMARAERPDLIIVDILMPGMDGYEFVRQLRGEPSIATTRTIFYTGTYSDGKARALAEACGVLRILVKPAEPAVVLEAVQEALSSSAVLPAAHVPSHFEREHRQLLADTVFEKVSELESANAYLRLSEIQYRAFFESNPLPMWVVDDATLAFLAVNEAAIRTYGYSREEFLRLSIRDIRPDEDILQLASQLAKHHEETLADCGIWQHRIKDGSLIEVAVFSHVTFFQGNRARMIVCEDVTERRRAERKLQESEQQLRELAGRLQMAREEERTRLARQLHDQLGQQLTALKMGCMWVSGRISEAPTLVRERLQASIRLVDETIATVRRLATELRPGILDLGLQAALEWQAEEFQTHSDVACIVDISADTAQLDSMTATEIFRIFQEILTNIARHAGASLVQVRLTQDQNELVFEVEDDGRGIRKEELTNVTSLGLLGMRERAALIGGHFSIRGMPQQGTLVEVRVPVHRAITGVP